MDRFVVQKHSMPPFPVFAKGLAMIGCDRDYRVLIQPVTHQHLEQTADHRIGVGNFSVIGFGGKVRLEWLWRIVRFVWIVEMQPEKEWSTRAMTQPPHGAVGDVFSPALPAAIAVLAWLWIVEVGIVDFESTLEPRSPVLDRIEHHRPKERCRVIALLM